MKPAIHKINARDLAESLASPASSGTSTREGVDEKIARRSLAFGGYLGVRGGASGLAFVNQFAVDDAMAATNHIGSIDNRERGGRRNVFEEI